MASDPFPHDSSSLTILLMIILLLLSIQTDAIPCRKSCGQIPVNYPFGIDDGCGSPSYRHILACSNSSILELRTPSGRYPIRNISYSSDPHIIVSDPFMWSCQDGNELRHARPFSLDTSIQLKLSPQNDYLFFNCSESDVIMESKPVFCERFPEQCDLVCDTSNYLCRHLPECDSALSGSSCCSYHPKGGASLRMMLEYCGAYTSVYWRDVGVRPGYKQVPEYGMRVDFEVHVTARCIECQGSGKGGGTCGFDTVTEDFSCLCDKGNATTNCEEYSGRNNRAGLVAGVVTVASVVGAFGIGVGVWHLRKLRTKAHVMHGVQSNENRLF